MVKRSRTLTLDLDADDIKRLQAHFTAGTARKALRLLREEFAHDLTEEVYRLANTQLRTSKIDYMSAVVPARVTATGVVIELDDNFIANMVELGSRAFNLASGLSSGEKRIVPFSFMTQRGAGLTHATDISVFIGAFRKKRSREVLGLLRQDMKVQAFGEPFRTRGMRRSAKIEQTVKMAASRLADADDEEPHGRRRTLESGFAPVLANRETGASHKGDIFEGLRRIEQTKAGSKYMTFRTMTPDQAGLWEHPGVEARDFFSQAAEVATTKLAKSLDEILKL